MFEIIGKFNRAQVYADQVDPASYAQVLQMCNLEDLKDCRIRMMPDMHASAGCTVGTSMTVGDRVNPAYVGGDIGCGMQVYVLHDRELDFAALDEAIREKIPSGPRVHARENPALSRLPMESLYCFHSIRHTTVAQSLGTLGGGNHFVEVDRDLEGKLYLVIHSGSRRLGRDVARFHQNVAYFAANGISQEEVRKKKLRPSDIKNSPLRPERCFLTGEYLDNYLHDMNIAVDYAKLSRSLMAEALIAVLGLDVEETFATVHNYIDTDHGILRKGAVSAREGERIIIPINMRDGSLICTGRGNDEWNCTAPHGSGRLMTRTQAKEEVSIEEYRRAMAGIYTTSVNESTLDESPMAYRPIEAILDTIEPTAEVVNIITPVYNFKASRPVTDEETMDGED